MLSLHIQGTFCRRDYCALRKETRVREVLLCTRDSTRGLLVVRYLRTRGLFMKIQGRNDA